MLLQGSHAELMAKKRVYYDLLSSQGQLGHASGMQSNAANSGTHTPRYDSAVNSNRLVYLRAVWFNKPVFGVAVQDLTDICFAVMHAGEYQSCWGRRRPSCLPGSASTAAGYRHTIAACCR